jgi:hypothetical protein
MTLDGELLDNHTGEWINQPSFNSFSDMMPNSWNAGADLSIPTGDRNPGVRPRLKFDSQTKT